MNNSILRTTVLPLLIVAAFLLWNSCYTVSMTEQVIITRFGEVQGGTVTEPGLHFKTPFVDTVNRFDKRFLEWDGPSVSMTTKDKQYLDVSTFARWRISDPLQFLVRVHDEESAKSRLDGLLGSSTRSTVANHNLIELIRTEKERKVKEDLTPGTEVAPLLGIQYGRVAIEKTILAQTQPEVKELGIELLDIRFKRLNYSRDVLEKIHDRMISERAQMAARFRSEGEGEAARIQGTRELELNRITSEAYRQVQEISGSAEAKASAIYAEAFNASPETADFYSFQKTLQTYAETAGPDTTLVLSTGSDLFRLMKSAGATPPPSSAEPPAAPNGTPPATPPANTPAAPPPAAASPAAAATTLPPVER